MKKLVIALPFFDGDREQAEMLALVVDWIQAKSLIPKRPNVEFCFVNKHGHSRINPAVMASLNFTFAPCTEFETVTAAEGHPKSGNAQAIDFFRESLRRVQTGQWKGVDAILWMEPDCVPVAHDWIDQLMHEWDYAITVAPALVVGCYRTENVDVPHVNGNALWHPELAKHIDLNVTMEGKGWDSALADQLKGRFVQTSLIANLWKETKVTDERMKANPFTPKGTPPPVLIHGVKDDSAWLFARRQLGI